MNFSQYSLKPCTWSFKFGGSIGAVEFGQGHLIPLACAPGQPNLIQSADACWQHLAPIDSLVYMDGAACFGCVRPFPATFSGHWQGRTKSNATPSFVFGLLLGWWIHCAGLLSWLAERCRAQTRLRQRSWLAVVPEHNHHIRNNPACLPIGLFRPGPREGD